VCGGQCLELRFTCGTCRNAVHHLHLWDLLVSSGIMPAQSTISASDKERIKSAFPSTIAKILTATLARIYYAYPSPNDWSYSGLQGAIVLVSDKIKGGFWLRLVDLSVSVNLKTSAEVRLRCGV
jgi:hypothetical protein